MDSVGLVTFYINITVSEIYDISGDMICLGERNLAVYS